MTLLVHIGEEQERGDIGNVMLRWLHINPSKRGLDRYESSLQTCALLTNLH